MKILNSREIEVLGILAAAGQSQTSTQIVNTSKELTQSTVQAVLRKLLAAGHVTVQGITHSGNVLSRTFGITDLGRETVRRDFISCCSMIRDIIDVQAILREI